MSLHRLRKLSLRGNMLTSLNFSNRSLGSLEELNVDKNSISSINGLDKLCSLVSLSVSSNILSELTASSPHSSLRILKACNNHLQCFDVLNFPQLRTVYLDNNFLDTISSLDSLKRLENLSCRSQGNGLKQIRLHHESDVKYMYLSFNKELSWPIVNPLYSLKYLEISGFSLERLPQNFATMVPNLRVLIASYNEISDLQPLADLSRLSILDLKNNHLIDSTSTLNILDDLPSLNRLDLRYNPITTPLYAAAVRDNTVTPELSIYQDSAEWLTHDEMFLSSMSPQIYALRQQYKSSIMGVCPQLKWLDGMIL